MAQPGRRAGRSRHPRQPEPSVDPRLEHRQRAWEPAGLRDRRSTSARPLPPPTGSIRPGRSGMSISDWPGLACQPAYAPLQVIGVNEYFGWFDVGDGTTDDRAALAPFLRSVRACYPNQAIFVTEFGLRRQPQRPRRSPRHLPVPDQLARSTTSASSTPSRGSRGRCTSRSRISPRGRDSPDGRPARHAAVGRQGSARPVRQPEARRSR